MTRGDMTRTFRSLALASMLAGTAAWADDDKNDGKSDSPSASTFHQSGALLDKSPQKRPLMLSFFAGIPYGGYYYYGFPFGVGARFAIPIVHDGFLPMLNDSFGIEFGADLYGIVGTAFYPTLGLPVEVYWAFHFTKTFAAYAKVGAVLELNFVPYANCNAIGCRGYSFVTASPIGNVGLIWHFSQKISLRAEAGYPWIKVGIGIDL